MAKKTEVLGENLPQRRFAHHKSHMTDLDFNLSRRWRKTATNPLNYGTAFP
jgi:hypothetical protein